MANSAYGNFDKPAFNIPLPQAPQMPIKQIRGRGGPLTAYISEAGGIGGGIAGGAAAGALAGSAILPGAGTLLGTAIGAGIGAFGGTTLGKAIEQKVRDDQAFWGKGGSAKKAYQEGLTSGLLTAVTAGASGIRAAGKAGIGAKEALKMTPKSIQEAKAAAQALKALTGSDRMLADAYNLLPNAKAKGVANLTTQESKELTKLVSQLTKGEFNPEQIAAVLENAKSTRGATIGELIKIHKKAISSSDMPKLQNDLNKVAANVVGLDPTNKKVQQIIADIVKSKNTLQLQNAKLSLQGQINTFDTAKSSPAIQEFMRKARNKVATLLAERVPGLETINKDYSLIERALPFVKDAATKNIGLRLPVGVGGLNLSLQGRAPAATKIALAKGAGKVGGVLSQSIKSPTVGPLLRAQVYKGLLERSAGVRGQQAIDPSTGLPITIDPTTGLPTSSQLDTSTTTTGTSALENITQQNQAAQLNAVRDAILQDMAATGGKNLKNIQTVATAYGVDLTPLGLGTTASKTDATTKRQLAGISTGLSVVNEIESLFSAAGGGAGRIGGLLKTAQASAGQAANIKVFKDARRAYASRLSKALGETGVLTDQDIARAIASIPDITNTPEEAALKFDSIKRIIQDAYNKLQAQG